MASATSPVPQPHASDVQIAWFSTEVLWIHSVVSEIQGLCFCRWTQVNANTFYFEQYYWGVFYSETSQSWLFCTMFFVPQSTQETSKSGSLQGASPTSNTLPDSQKPCSGVALPISALHLYFPQLLGMRPILFCGTWGSLRCPHSKLVMQGSSSLSWEPQVDFNFLLEPMENMGQFLSVSCTKHM